MDGVEVNGYTIGPGADLFKADLTGTDLYKADLRRANLRRANLRRANLRRANLRRADLRRADLKGADLTGADLSGAIADNGTVWPEGFSPVAAGVSSSEVGVSAVSVDEEGDLRCANCGGKNFVGNLGRVRGAIDYLMRRMGIDYGANPYVGIPDDVAHRIGLGWSQAEARGLARSSIAIQEQAGVRTLATQEHLRCQQCGKYHKQGNAKPGTGDTGATDADETIDDTKRRQLEAAAAAAGGFEWRPGQGPGIRFDPKATRKPGQILKFHVTLEEMMEPGDKPNWGWVDPPEGLSEEEISGANRQASQAFAEAIGRADELDPPERVEYSYREEDRRRRPNAARNQARATAAPSEEDPLDLVDRLERLQRLHADGFLSEEEFAAAKANLLD